MACFFQNTTEVDCSASPYDALPVAEAVLAEVARVRAISRKPIVILSGEQHDLPAQVLLPYAFLLKSGLVGTATPSALRGIFKLGMELPHNFLTMQLNSLMKSNAEPEALAAIQKADTDGARLLQVLKTWGDTDSVHARQFLYDQMIENKVPAVATDTAIRLSSDEASYGIDGTDPLTRVFMRRAKCDASEAGLYSPKGIEMRNRLTASLLRQELGEECNVIWKQIGAGHLFGYSRMNAPFSTSLAGLFNVSVQRGEVHVIAVMNKQDSANIGTDGAAFAGAAILYSGLSDKTDHHLRADKNCLDAMHAKLGLPPAAFVKQGADRQQAAAKHVVKNLYLHWVNQAP